MLLVLLCKRFSFQGEMFTFMIQHIELSIDHSTQRESEALMVNSGLFLLFFFFNSQRVP